METIQLPLGDVVELLNSNGFYVSRLATPGQIEKVIGLLKPWNTGHELIRLGSDGDGGYLLPNDLENIGACFSPGVSHNSSFEAALAQGFGIKSFLADHSVDGPGDGLATYDFEKKHLGCRNDETSIRLEDWVNQKAPGETELILQMDIEGAEYPVLIDTSPETLNKFRIIIIELHNLSAIASHDFNAGADAVFQKLTRNHSVVHLHPNNHQDQFRIGEFEIPRVMEVTLLRNDRIDRKRPRCDFPHWLDRPNDPDKPELALPSCWYA